MTKKKYLLIMAMILVSGTIALGQNRPNSIKNSEIIPSFQFLNKTDGDPVFIYAIWETNRNITDVSIVGVNATLQSLATPQIQTWVNNLQRNYHDGTNLTFALIGTIVI